MACPVALQAVHRHGWCAVCRDNSDTCLPACVSSVGQSAAWWYLQYNTIQYKFIYMAAISWTKRKTITHKQGHAFKITLLEVGQRKRYKRVLKTSCPCTDRWIWLRRSQPFGQLWVSLGRQQVLVTVLPSKSPAAALPFWKSYGTKILILWTDMGLFELSDSSNPLFTRQNN